MTRLRWICLLMLLAGCQPPLAQLTFPYRKLIPSTQPQNFDVDRDGKDDFAITFNDAGQVDALCYDDNEDGTSDRVYHLADYAQAKLPHVVILLDSVPYQSVADRYAAGEFRWFGPPAKVLAPFPSLTELCYTDVLHAPPMPAMIDQYYDPKTQKIHNGLWSRSVGGYEYPWERYLHYRAPFIDEGFAYLDPLPWYQAELERARKAMNASPDRITVVYLTSASGTICKYGQSGVDAVMDGAARLCLQLLYERHGAIKISLMADHGHNLMATENIPVADFLREQGFNPASSLKKPKDVVLEMNGLVTYAAARTMQPAAVSTALVKHPAIDFAMYLQGDEVIIEAPSGSAAIRVKGDRLAYKVISHDVLGYEPVIKSMTAAGKLDADGFAARDDWFAATMDAQYPDAPPRLWDAFHRLVVNPPDVMFTTRNGYSAGLPSFERFIAMKSSHGSFDQINTATFLMTMHGPELKTMRSWDVMHAIEPAWVPGVVRSKR